MLSSPKVGQVAYLLHFRIHPSAFGFPMPNAPSTNLASSTPAPRRPRATKPPSERDLDIYYRVKIKGFEQIEVAQEHGLHYSRVCQIVKRVARWLATGGCPANPLLRDHAARQRLTQANLKLRLNRAIQLATVALELPNNVETTRRRVQGLTEIWREETTRSAPRLDLKALRTLIDATQALQKLEAADEVQGNPPNMSDEDLTRVVFDILYGIRFRAEQSGTLPVCGDIRAALTAALTTFLGPTASEIFPVTLELQSNPAASAIPSAQAPLPTPQSTFPSPQVIFPTAQEPLNLSANGTNPIVPTASLSSLSIMPPPPTTNPLEHLP